MGSVGHSLDRHLLFDRVRGIRACYQASPGKDHRGFGRETSSASSNETFLGGCDVAAEPLQTVALRATTNPSDEIILRTISNESVYGIF